MLSKILGVIWMIAGLFWLIKPETLKRWLVRRATRRYRIILIIIIFVAGAGMIGSVLKVPGILPKIIMVVGLLLVIKALRLMTSKAKEGLSVWWEDRPIVFFRCWAAAVAAIGFIMYMA